MVSSRSMASSRPIQPRSAAASIAITPKPVPPVATSVLSSPVPSCARSRAIPLPGCDSSQKKAKVCRCTRSSRASSGIVSATAGCSLRQPRTMSCIVTSRFCRPLRGVLPQSLIEVDRPFDCRAEAAGSASAQISGAAGALWRWRQIAAHVVSKRDARRALLLAPAIRHRRPMAGTGGKTWRDGLAEIAGDVNRP